jgi:hypothetical protein
MDGDDFGRRISNAVDNDVTVVNYLENHVLASPSQLTDGNVECFSFAGPVENPL